MSVSYPHFTTKIPKSYEKSRVLPLTSDVSSFDIKCQ